MKWFGSFSGYFIEVKEDKVWCLDTILIIGAFTTMSALALQSPSIDRHVNELLTLLSFP